MARRKPATPPEEERPPPAVPATDEVVLWRVELDSPGADLSCLSGDERARAARFLRPLPRRRWEAARCALRTVLGRHLGLPPAAIELQTAPRGKPRLAGDSPLRFNLSHSEELALIAVTGGPEVGVDVERRRDRPPAFYEEWVRREAAAKCFGGGLGEPPPDRPMRILPLDLGDDWAAALAVAGDDEPLVRRLELTPADASATAAPARR